MNTRSGAVNYVRLSYDIDRSMPLYPGTPPPVRAQDKSIAKNDSCNTSVLTMSNHTGTHIDYPLHFFESGSSACDYAIGDLIFSSPLIVDCPKNAMELIEARDLTGISELSSADLLILRTGFQALRISDPDTYSFRNPCLTPEAANMIRRDYPNVRCFGIDCISISSRSHRDLGREAHRTLLKNEGYPGMPVLILEDLQAPVHAGRLDKVFVVPLFIKDLDASPCTVIGAYYDT